MKSLDIKKIGNTIKSQRVNAGLTQSELAEKVGISSSAIGMYEQGRRTPPVDVLYDISNALNVSFIDLVPEVNEKENTYQINTIAAHLPKGVELTEEERNELTNYANYIISKRKD